MSDYDHGHLRTFEITWTSGRIERIQAHQVTWPHGSILGPFFEAAQKRDDRVMLHGEIDGHWQLVLAARPEDIISIRNLTAAPDSLDGEMSS